jgi:hypothetical protein
LGDPLLKAGKRYRVTVWRPAHGRGLLSPFDDFILSMQEKSHIGTKQMAELHWGSNSLGHTRNKALNLTLL